MNSYLQKNPQSPFLKQIMAAGPQTHSSPCVWCGRKENGLLISTGVALGCEGLTATC